MARIHQVMPQGESRRPQPHNQNLIAAFGQRHRLFEIQRVPACQQAVDFESPRQSQNIFDDPGLHLGNFYRFLFLVNTGLGTLVADTVASTRHHGIIYGDYGHGSQGIAVCFDLVHL